MPCPIDVAPPDHTLAEKKIRGVKEAMKAVKQNAQKSDVRNRWEHNTTGKSKPAPRALDLLLRSHMKKRGGVSMHNKKNTIPLHDLGTSSRPHAKRKVQHSRAGGTTCARNRRPEE